MSTCAGCEWWHCDGSLMQFRPDSAFKIMVGACGNEYAFPRPCVQTWKDFPACPRFKAKQHWSEIAAELISKLSVTWDTFKKSAAQIIREEAEKAGVK